MEPDKNITLQDNLSSIQFVARDSHSPAELRLFTVGFMFGRFPLTSLEDFQFYFESLGVLEGLVRDSMISQEHRNMILKVLVFQSKELLPKKKFEYDLNNFINLCINDKMTGSHSFRQQLLRRDRVKKVDVFPQHQMEEDDDARYIRELLEKEKAQLKSIEQVEKMNLEAARKLQQQEVEQKVRQELSKQAKLVCPICLQNIEYEDIALLQCQHSFHRACISQCFKANIQDRKFPIRCPEGQCNNEVLVSDVSQYLQILDLQKYQQYTLAQYVDLHQQDMSWCPTAGCKYCFVFDEGTSEFGCPVCRKTYCLKCKTQYHKGMTCKQYQINRTFNKDDEAFIAFVRGAKYKQCPKCKFWVEKNEGCDHMTCRCHFEFCYVCGGVYQACECHGGAHVEPVIPGYVAPAVIRRPTIPARPPPVNPNRPARPPFKR